MSAKLRKLLEAVWRNDRKAVLSLINGGVDLNGSWRFNTHIRYWKGTTPLYLASHCNYLEIAKILIKKGAEVNKTTQEEQCTPLYIAADYGHSGMVKLLLEHGAEANKTVKVFHEESTALYVAARNGHAEVVKLLLQHGAKVNMPAKTFMEVGTPLFVAAHFGRSKVVKLLIEQGADVNTASNDISPLWTASHGGYLDVVKILLENGARVDTPNPRRNNLSPLSITFEMGRFEIAKLLIINGADIQQRDKFGNSLLHFACRRAEESMALFLIENGADINAVNYNKETPLHVSVNKESEHLELIKLLLRRGVDTEARDNNGYTAWEKAQNFRQTEIKELILSGQGSKKRLLQTLEDATPDNNSSVRNVGNSGNTKLLNADHDVNGLDFDDDHFTFSIENHRVIINKFTKDILNSSDYISERMANQDVTDMSELTPAHFTNASRREFSKISRFQFIPSENEPVLSDSLTEESEEKAKEINSDHNKHEDHRQNVIKFTSKCLETSHFISDIPMTISKNIEQKSLSLLQLKRKYLQKLVIKEREVKQLEQKVDEMQKVTGSLSQDCEELTKNVLRNEVAKAQLNRQIEEMKKEHRGELLEERQKSKRQLQTQRDELFKEGERRVCTLKSRNDELEQGIRALLEKNANLEGTLELLSIKYEERVRDSSARVDSRVAVKRTNKDATGLREATKSLRSNLSQVDEIYCITINNNHNVQSIGPVTATLTGGFESNGAIS